MKNYNKASDESYDDFFVRIGQGVEDHDMTWNAATDILNKATGQNFNEATYRKRYRNFSDGMKYQQAKHEAGMDADVLTKLQEERRLLEQEKIKVRDERNEVARLNRESARRSSFDELLLRCIKAYDSPMWLSTTAKAAGKDELIVHLTDLHMGIGIKNLFNSYDKNVAGERVMKYAAEILKIAEKHDANVVHVVFGGDMVSGLIHTNLRLENNENVVQQTMNAADLCSAFVLELAKQMKQVNLSFVAGNHGRVSAAKEDNVPGENFDWFIPFYMKAKLQNWKNVRFLKTEKASNVAMFECCGNFVVATHGDKDTKENVVQKLTMVFGRKPEIVLMGHRHNNGMTTVYDTKVIESGCVSGPDAYCMGNRLRNRPEQMVAVCDEHGLKCFYDIQLD